jgi:hypothetical protein
VTVMMFGQSTTPNGSEMTLFADFSSGNNTITTVTVQKDGEPEYQPLVEVIRNSDGLVVRSQVTAQGSPIVYDVSAVGSRVFLDTEGHLQAPWSIRFG